MSISTDDTQVVPTVPAAPLAQIEARDFTAWFGQR